MFTPTISFSDYAKGTIARGIKCSCSFNNYRTDQIKSPNCSLPSANLPYSRTTLQRSWSYLSFLTSNSTLPWQPIFPVYQVHSRTLILLHPLNASTSTFLSEKYRQHLKSCLINNLSAELRHGRGWGMKRVLLPKIYLPGAILCCYSTSSCS